jgi:hypothetical protein
MVVANGGGIYLGCTSGHVAHPDIPPPPIDSFLFILRMNSGCAMMNGAAKLSIASS